MSEAIRDNVVPPCIVLISGQSYPCSPLLAREVHAHYQHVLRHDGVQGEVQFRPSFFRGVFAHLIDDQEFNQVRLVDGVVTWPQELDLAPDAMHDALMASKRWIVE